MGMDAKMNMAIASELRAMRTEVGITQQKLADMLGKPQSYISKVESGKRDLHLAEISDYAAGLGIDIDNFMHRIDVCIKECRAQETKQM